MWGAGGKGLREARDRSYLHMLVLDTDQNRVGTRFLGGVGDAVRPVLVILDHRSHRPAWRQEFSKATHAQEPAPVAHPFRT